MTKKRNRRRPRYVGNQSALSAQLVRMSSWFHVDSKRDLGKELDRCGVKHMKFG